MVARAGFKNVIKVIIKRVIKVFPSSLKNYLFKALLEESWFCKERELKELDITECVLLNLRDNGFSPTSIIDCGAYVGWWTRSIKNIFPSSRVLMIEANPGKEAELRKVKSEYPQTVDYAICLLGAEDRTNIRFYNMESGSSVLEEQSDVPRDILFLSMKTLDEIANEKGFSDPTLIKIDVQGYEIEVLKGAANILKKAEFILLEVSFLQYNKSAPLVSEVIDFMKNNGFVIFDIGSLMRWGNGNTLLQGDIFFIKQGSIRRHKFFDFKSLLSNKTQKY